MINIHNHTDIHLYLQQVKTFLSEKPSENNLSLGILYARQDTTAEENEYFISGMKKDQVIFTIIKTHHNFIIAGSVEYIDQISDYLFNHNIRIPCIIGGKNLAIALARRYCSLSKKSWEITMEQMVYRITKLKTIQSSEGALHIATEADLPLVARWLCLFCKEVLDFMTEEQSLDFAKKGIAEKSIYLWKTTENVAMVKSARPADKGIVVNFVYTPVEHRGHGYATSVVHQLSSILLESYEFCSLFTDAKNPTSNAIYTKIGYEKVGDAAVVKIV